MTNKKRILLAIIYGGLTLTLHGILQALDVEVYSYALYATNLVAFYTIFSW